MSQEEQALAMNGLLVEGIFDLSKVSGIRILLLPYSSQQLSAS